MSIIDLLLSFEYQQCMNNKTIVIDSEYMGKGSDELGKILMGSFLRNLWGGGDHPKRIIFYNSGVKLLSKDSACLDALTGLVKDGVELFACGTCLSFYEIADQLECGHVSNMQEIVSMMIESGDIWKV